jgi:predicted enzyme related to lactoylglutathione lyase
VPDALAAVAEASDHGATILREPFDILKEGSVATLRDPVGAVISLWEPLDRMGATLVDVPNAHCCTELVTSDLVGAKSFYGDVFGWRYEDDSPGRSRVVGLPGPRVAMRVRDEGSALREGWLPYFLVEEAGAAAKSAQELGGTHLGGTLAYEDAALLTDPTGARFAVRGR